MVIVSRIDSTLLHYNAPPILAVPYSRTTVPTKRLMKSFLLVVSPVVYERQVTDQAGILTMNVLPNKGKQFKHHPHALYATDVTFQQTNRPSGNHQESKRYFSGKNRLYGYKVEVSVLPNGLALVFSLHRHGSVSDLTMFREGFDWHENASEKKPGDMVVSDHGPLQTQFPMKWAILTDKGYQGANDTLRVLFPKKKRPHRALNFDELHENAELSSDWVIVENYFGRCTLLWEVTSLKYMWSEDMYDSVFQMCMGLANIHICMHPLRDANGEYYQTLRNKWFTIGEEGIEKGN